MNKNIVIVSFICARDYCLVPYFYAAIKKINKELPIVFVYDGKEEAPKFRGHNISFVASNFERRGNLNGKECITGMMDFYHKLISQYGVDIIVKADVDCFITALSWINPLFGGYNMAGFQCSNGYYCTGVCYAIDARAVCAIREYLQQNDIETSAGHILPEDMTTTLLCLYSGGRVKVHNNAENLYCIPFLNATANNPAILRKSNGVIHLGQWQRIQPLVSLGLNRNDIVMHDYKTVFRAISPKEIPYNWHNIPLHSVIAQTKQKTTPA